jgi:hypothetical protein
MTGELQWHDWCMGLLWKFSDFPKMLQQGLVWPVLLTGLTGAVQWCSSCLFRSFSSMYRWLLVPRTSSTLVATWSWPTWVVESEMCFGSHVRLVGVLITSEKNFYRLPFTPPWSPDWSFNVETPSSVEKLLSGGDIKVTKWCSLVEASLCGESSGVLGRYLVTWKQYSCVSATTTWTSGGLVPTDTMGWIMCKSLLPLIPLCVFALLSCNPCLTLLS